MNQSELDKALASNPDLKVISSTSALDVSKPERNKHGNIQRLIDGETYGSGKEAVDAQNFRLAVKAGEYIAYLHHVRFPLLDDGTYYEADHVLINNDLTVSVLDTKAFNQKTGKYLVTDKFSLKRRMFRQKYHQDIKLI